MRSGQQMAVYPAGRPTPIGGGRPPGHASGQDAWARSTAETFNEDLLRLSPSYPVTAGDPDSPCRPRSCASIWAALKKLDTIVPGVLHPSTIMYYPEIKMYANKPVFLDRHFRVSGNVFMVGDGAGTSRGITGAWASGIRAAEDTGRELTQGGPAVPIAAISGNPLLLIPRDTVCLSPTTVRVFQWPLR